MLKGFFSSAFAVLFLSNIFFSNNLQAQTQHNSSDYDVVIIGGGISGLTSLHELQKKGITKVLLVEAEKRVGGKMWTQRSRQNGPYYERGAELVNTSDTELISLVKELGLSLTHRRFKRELRHELLMFRDKTLTPDGRIIEGDLRRFSFEELVSKMHEFPQDVLILDNIYQWNARRKNADPAKQKQLKDRLQSMQASSLVANGVYTKALFEALMQSEFGVGLHQVHAEVLLDYASVERSSNTGSGRYNVEIIPGADEKFRVTGGTDAIIAKLEERHKARILKDSPVESVDQITTDQFNISIKEKTGSTKTIKAKHVIFAVPAYALAKIKINSTEVSPQRLKDAAQLPFGHNAKIFLIFKQKFWNAAYNSDKNSFSGVGLLESGTQFWDTTENQKGVKEGVITLYPGEWPVNAAEQQKKLAQILAELRQVPGLENLDAHLLKIDIQNWPKSYAGVFNKRYKSAPKLFAEELKSNIYFVGADKDNNTKGEISESYGYMNGAVRTALRATDRISSKTKAAAQSSQVLRSKGAMCSALFSKAG